MNRNLRKFESGELSKVKFRISWFENAVNWDYDADAPCQDWMTVFCKGYCHQDTTEFLILERCPPTISPGDQCWTVHNKSIYVTFHDGAFMFDEYTDKS